MRRIIYFKVRKFGHMGTVSYTEHNMEIGGEGDLTRNQVRLVKKKIMNSACYGANQEDSIVLCNVIQVKEK